MNKPGYLTSRNKPKSALRTDGPFRVGEYLAVLQWSKLDGRFFAATDWQVVSITNPPTLALETPHGTLQSVAASDCFRAPGAAMAEAERRNTLLARTDAR